MVNSTQTDALTITPTKVRYCLRLDRLNGIRAGMIDLIRSQKCEDGTWIDDPRRSARKSIPLPPAANDALDALEAIVPTIANRLGVSGPIAGHRLRLGSMLDEAGRLDVVVQLQLLTNSGWLAKTIASLNGFMPQNPDLAESISATWANLDASLNAANAAEGWM